MFYDAFEFSGWPFTDIDQAQIHEYITAIESENDIVYFLNAKRSFVVSGGNHDYPSAAGQICGCSERTI